MISDLPAEVISIYEAPVTNSLVARGFTFERRISTGVLFAHPTRDLRVIVDLGICERKDLAYIDYTSVQNEWMGQPGKTLRFAVESHDQVSIVVEEIEFFVTDGEKNDSLKSVRRGREETHPDPTHPEARFEVILLPGGEVLSATLKKSSGNPAYDAAVERAIMAAQPLPVPTDTDLFQENFRELNMTFRPKD